MTGRVRRDAQALIKVGTAEICRVDEGRAWRVELRHERVSESAKSRLERPGGRGEVGRFGKASHIGVARGVHRDAESVFAAAAAEIGGVDERRTRGIQPRHEGVEAAGGGT